MDAFVDGNGLFGVCNHREAVHLTYLGLHALQHRGRAGVSLAGSDGTSIRSTAHRGRVSEALGAAELAGVVGSIAAGTVWGGTPSDGGASRLVVGRTSLGSVAAMVSGRFTNGDRMRSELQSGGALFIGESDAELLLHLVARSSLKTIVNRMVDALFGVTGAYAALLLTEDRLVAVRDPAGFRPLWLGRLDEGWAVSSDDAALGFAGAAPERMVAPGEMVILEGGRDPIVVKPFRPTSITPCVHELVDLARADASMFDRSVYSVRRRLGARLAKEEPCDHVDVVVAVPGAEAQAEGFAEASGRPLAPGLLQERFAPSHLEEPASSRREYVGRAQMQAVPAVVEGRRVCLVAASAPVGSTAATAVQRLVEAGATEVHVRVASPMVRRGCRYGVASPATLLEPGRLREPEPLGAHSVGFLGVDGLLREAGGPVCDACFSGEFPIPPDEADGQLDLFGSDGGDGEGDA